MGFWKYNYNVWPLYYIAYIHPQTIEPFLALKTAWILPSQLDWIFSRSQMVIKCFNLSKSIRYLASISASDWSTTPKSFKTEALSSLLCLKKAGMQSVRLSCNARIILSRVNWPEVTLTWPEVSLNAFLQFCLRVHFRLFQLLFDPFRLSEHHIQSW